MFFFNLNHMYRQGWGAGVGAGAGRRRVFLAPLNRSRLKKKNQGPEPLKKSQKPEPLKN